MYPLPTPRRSPSLAALLTLPLLLAGTAYAVDDVSNGSASKAAAPRTSGVESVVANAETCAQGNLRGYARVKGLESTPDEYTASANFIIDRYDCTGFSSDVQVKRIGKGRFAVKFRSGLTGIALATSQTNSGHNVAVTELGPAEWRVNVRKSGTVELRDAPFYIAVM
jgi:hypothetical protein